MWTINTHKDDDSTFTELIDPQGKKVLGAKISQYEEDANEFWVDRERLLTALNGEQHHAKHPSENCR